MEGYRYLRSNREVGRGHPYIVVDSDDQCVAQLHAIVDEFKLCRDATQDELGATVDVVFEDQEAFQG